ncbi:hypothetical protein JCM10207_000932 [Rhodosporidiobolus poonsookiae]
MLPPGFVKPPPASRLSEESMDLVCSFVREWDSDRDVVRTLRALCLTSRNWLSSALRALWHDPSRALVVKNDGASRLLHLVLTRPRLAVHIRRLELPSTLLTDPDECPYSCNALAMQNYLLTLFRSCPDITSLSVDSGMGDDILPHLSLLPHLDHLTIAEESGEISLNLAAYLKRLSAQWPASVNALTIQALNLFDDWLKLVDAGNQGVPVLTQPLEYIKLKNCDMHVQHLVEIMPCLAAPTVKHLHISSDSFLGADLTPLISPALQSFTFLWNHLTPEPYLFGRDCQSYFLTRRHPLPVFPSTPSLTRLTFQATSLSLQGFEKLTSAFPNLEYLDLRDSIWHGGEWIPPFYSSAVSVLLECTRALPALKHLALGFLPLVSHAHRLPAVQRACFERGINFSFQPFYPYDFNESLGEVESEEEEVWRTEAPSSGASDDELDWWVDEIDDPADWERYRLARFPDEHARDAPSRIDYAPSTAPTSINSDFFSPEPESPSPSFLVGPPDEPRFEADYEALDEADEDDVEPWMSWSEDVSRDIGEGDRSWRELECGE